MSFTSLAAVKTAMGIPSGVTKLDAQITPYVDAVNAAILDFLGIDSAAPTQYLTSVDLTAYQGATLRNIRIGPRPVISVDRVTVSGTVLESTSYIVRGDIVRFNTACRPIRAVRDLERRSVEIVATCGFADSDPGALLTQGATAWALSMYKNPQGLKSEKWGTYRRDRFSPQELAGVNAPASWPPVLAMALAPWTRMTVMVETSVENNLGEAEIDTDLSVHTQTAGAYTVLTSDDVLLGDAGAGVVTFTLPTAVGSSKRYIFKKIDSSGNNVVIETYGSETIDGASSQSIILANGSIEVVSDGTNWHIIG